MKTAIFLPVSVSTKMTASEKSFIASVHQFYELDYRSTILLFIVLGSGVLTSLVVFVSEKMAVDLQRKFRLKFRK